MQAEAQMQLITAITFPHWSGDSNNAKAAAREGNRKRTKYLRELRKAAGSDGGVDVLTTGDQLVAWLGAHGIDATEGGVAA